MSKRAIYRRKYKEMQKLALKRMYILYDRAKSEFFEHRERSHRYAYLARKLAMRARVKLPINFKRQICKHCHKFIVIGFNARMRLRPKRVPHIAVTCLECNHVMRYPYLQEKRLNYNAREKNKNTIKITPCK